MFSSFFFLVGVIDKLRNMDHQVAVRASRIAAEIAKKIAAARALQQAEIRPADPETDKADRTPLPDIQMPSSETPNETPLPHDGNYATPLEEKLLDERNERKREDREVLEDERAAEREAEREAEDRKAAREAEEREAAREAARKAACEAARKAARKAALKAALKAKRLARRLARALPCKAERKAGKGH